LSVWISVSAFEQLVERAEAAGKDHEALGGLHEADLARVEVIEREVDVDVGVLVLLVRQVDVEADREAAPVLRPAVRRLHHAGAAAGDHRPAGLGEEATRRSRGLVRGMAFVHARRPEQRHCVAAGSSRRPRSPSRTRARS
jgi:hypothetical protein